VNRLAGETSSYLRQHQNNPVDWYPWGDLAFERALEEDRPVLLSVGYSACHWCHVMAHESFEDPDLAAIQNRLFVNIKVDREERPDVDRIYMDALQALTGGGGWPMTVFLLPDGRPFFAGTYFPPDDRPGLPGFRRVMESLAAAYRDRREEVVASAERLTQALAPAPLVPAPLDGMRMAEILASAEERLLRGVDREYGGFGGAPKFPQCAALDFLLTREALSQSQPAGEVVQSALQAMAQGGIRDHLGEGFHRYSVDQRWAVPHFEKMLYDNAQLLRLYLRSWQARGQAAHLDMARRAADFLIDQLRLPAGGFAASLDADTEQGEGAYYAWSEAELVEALGQDRLQLAITLFGGPGDARTEQGDMVLRGGAHAEVPSLAEGELTSARQTMVRQLAMVRSRRPPPGRDDKLIVGWNALAIVALSELALATGESGYLEEALRGADVIVNQASVDGRLCHLFDGTAARFSATLEDLAGFALACLALHEVTGQGRWFDLALEQATRIEAEYADPEGPGWFDSPANHDRNLKVRPRSLEDGAQASGVSQMAELCLRLHALTGDDSWRIRVTEFLSAMTTAMERFPSAFAALLSVMAVLESGQIELALICSDQDRAHWPLLERARSRLRPELAVGVGRLAPGQREATSGPPLVFQRTQIDGSLTAYVCRGFTCRLPVTDGEALERELGRAVPPRLG
jgi:uncharacterized protein YyaL (SSP411 family)